MIKRALISVSDKTGLVELGKALKHFQVEIISTGGTASALQEANVDVVQVSDYTGFPEIMDGRLKTLHPRVHGGLLGRRSDPKDEEFAQTYGIRWIDLVVVNLYPFEDVVENNKRPEYSDLIENIDIGGPAMIRAAAKNNQDVVVVVDPSDYKDLIRRLKSSGQEEIDREYCYEMAMKAFHHTAIYDSRIAETLSQYRLKEEGQPLERENFPRYHFISGKLGHELRYGENPHQKAAVYRLQYPREGNPLGQSLQGKELSFNNYLDADSAWRVLTELPPKSTVIVKHNNACGVGMGESESESFLRARGADPESAFGGIVAISGNIDEKLAREITENFVEIVCAESIDVDARDVFAEKKNLRLLLLPSIKNLSQEEREFTDIRKIQGSYLVQEGDQLGQFGHHILGPDLSCATKKEPSKEEMDALCFAWVVAKNTKSNAIVIANQTQTLGIGAGEVNRKFASEAAVRRAEKFDSKIRVCASDGFFPFADGVELLRKGGVSAIIQPGGSIRDQEVIDACDAAGISMLFTKARHFRH